MPAFNVHDAESNLSKLLDMALGGEEVIISRHGKPIAKLTPLRTRTGERVLGAGRGSVKILDEDWSKAMSDEEAGAFWDGCW